MFEALDRRQRVLLSLGGRINTDTQPRDSRRRQHRPHAAASVLMQNARICQLSANLLRRDPAYPTTDINVTVVAYVLLDSTGVVARAVP
jgi:hypothetical protein